VTFSEDGLRISAAPLPAGRLAVSSSGSAANHTGLGCCAVEQDSIKQLAAATETHPYGKAPKAVLMALAALSWR
jgi:hypothetical protein